MNPPAGGHGTLPDTSLDDSLPPADGSLPDPNFDLPSHRDGTLPDPSLYDPSRRRTARY